MSSNDIDIPKIYESNIGYVYFFNDRKENKTFYPVFSIKNKHWVQISEDSSDFFELGKNCQWVDFDQLYNRVIKGEIFLDSDESFDGEYYNIYLYFEHGFSLIINIDFNSRNDRFYQIKSWFIENRNIFASKSIMEEETEKKGNYKDGDDQWTDESWYETEAGFYVLTADTRDESHYTINWKITEDSFINHNESLPNLTHSDKLKRKLSKEEVERELIKIAVNKGFEEDIEFCTPDNRFISTIRDNDWELMLDEISQEWFLTNHYETVWHNIEGWAKILKNV